MGWFSTHRIYIKKVHQNDVWFSPAKITLKKVHRNDVKFLPIKTMSNKARPDNLGFSSFRSTLKKFVETTWILVDIFFWRINIILTLNQRRFNVLCPLLTLLFIIPPVVIRFELFESRRPKDPLKLALKISEKVTLNELMTRGTGQTKFIKVLDKSEVKSCHFSFR